ncbi:MAG TPA: hypothetical protein VFH51_08165 [Myxococcota bacterium]|nr:hypothetical protein [Myxococcota bacterium]
MNLRSAHPPVLLGSILTLVLASTALAGNAQGSAAPPEPQNVAKIVCQLCYVHASNYPDPECTPMHYVDPETGLEATLQGFTFAAAVGATCALDESLPCLDAFALSLSLRKGDAWTSEDTVLPLRRQALSLADPAGSGERATVTCRGPGYYPLTE